MNLMQQLINNIRKKNKKIIILVVGTVLFYISCEFSALWRRIVFAAGQIVISTLSYMIYGIGWS